VLYCATEVRGSLFIENAARDFTKFHQYKVLLFLFMCFCHLIGSLVVTKRKKQGHIPEGGGGYFIIYVQSPQGHTNFTKLFCYLIGSLVVTKGKKQGQIPEGWGEELFYYFCSVPTGAHKFYKLLEDTSKF
jgi:hypothetical protein